MRSTLGLAASAIAITMATAAPALAQDTVRVGAAVYGLRAEFMQLWSDALRQHPAIEEGIVEVEVFDGNYDALTQQNQIETMITRQFDAIIFIPIDADAGAAAVQMAFDAGIPVIGSNTGVNLETIQHVIDAEGYIYIGSDDVLSGRMEAEAVLEGFCDEGGRVVIIEGPIGQSAQIERRAGNLEALEACPAVEVLEMQTANWSRAEALTLMENWLTSYQAEIDGIIGQNDEMALGAIEAIKQAGLDVNDFAIAGIDGVADALEAVKRGEMVSILQDASAQAQGSLDLALRRVLGEDYEPRAVIWTTPETAWYHYGERMPWNGGNDLVYNVPWTPVTLDNVEELMAARN